MRYDRILNLFKWANYWDSGNGNMGESEVWRVCVRMKGARLMGGQGEDKGIWVLIEFNCFPHVFTCSLVHSVCACPLILSHRGVQTGHYSVVHLRPHSRLRWSILTGIFRHDQNCLFFSPHSVSNIYQDFCHLSLLNSSTSSLHTCYLETNRKVLYHQSPL